MTQIFSLHVCIPKIIIISSIIIEYFSTFKSSCSPVNRYLNVASHESLGDVEILQTKLTNTTHLVNRHSIWSMTRSGK